MNNYYFSDSDERIYKEKPDGFFTMVTSDKDFETFVNDYEELRADGNSIIDSLEFAK